MTAKEEAKQLVEKFENEIGQSDFHIPKFISGVECADGSDEYGRILDDETRDIAKQCALVCVNRILKVCKSMLPKTYIEYGSNIEKEIDHLENVKLEIKKL